MGNNRDKWKYTNAAGLSEKVETMKTVSVVDFGRAKHYTCSDFHFCFKLATTAIFLFTDNNNNNNSTAILMKKKKLVLRCKGLDYFKDLRITIASS